MKKTYIAPDVLIVEIETQFVIADSPVTFGILSEGNGNDAMESVSRSTLWGED